LEELAENLWWSWNPGARMLFKTLKRYLDDEVMLSMDNKAGEKQWANTI
jgi:hypothetical protein